MAPLTQYSALALSAFATLTNAISMRYHDDAHFVPDIVLRASVANISTACTTMESVIINGTSPGPQIEIPAGRSTWVRVYNDIPHDNFTIHWHGISQKLAIFSDGTPQAAQWPIPPNRFFDYEIRPGAADAGTYFYHSHVGFQALTAHGALIVKDNGTAPYRYDEERTFLIGDYYNLTETNLTTGLRTPLPNFQWSGEVAGVLLNGLGQAQYSANPQLPGCVPVPIIDVDPGRTYRFRAIGATAMTFAAWVFQNHSNIPIIAADASYTKPHPVNYFQMGSGERFDFLLTTKTRRQLRQEGSPGWYWIQIETRERPDVPVVYSYAMLRYNKNVKPKQRPATPPLTLPLVDKNWLERTLEPMVDNGFPKNHEVTRVLHLNITQPVDGNMRPVFEFNGVSWNEYDGRNRPYLVDIYNKGEAAIPNWDRAMQNQGWDPEFKAYPIRVGEVLDIVLHSPPPDGGAFDTHPFHLHGQHFFDIGQGRGNYDQAANYRAVARSKPVLRDTTMIYKYDEEFPGNDTVAQTGWRAWRIRVNDPGVWMFHCHIIPHMIMGMQAVFVVGNASEIQKIPQPYVSGYLEYGGSALGSRDRAPMVLHQYDD